MKSKPVLEEEIGQGSFGTIYRGKLGKKTVAIKKISRNRLDRCYNESRDVNKTISSFQKEAKVLALATHQNIVKFYGVFGEERDEDSILLVMELMNQDLYDYLKANKGQFSIGKEIDICLQIASGLKYLHNLKPVPILHRDLAPANVLVDEEGTIFKVSDFGQSKFRPSPDAYFTSKVPGNLLYMPPESFEGSPASIFTRKGDVFSLGVTMLHVATQSSPSCGWFGAGIIPEVERRKADLEKLQNDNPLKPLILECLRDHPDERPDAGQVCEKLINLYVSA